MNSKRKADLQRRLSLAPVARPPADLLDRIKSDIPEYLRPDADRKRLTRSIGFNMRVAASILIVVSSVIGAIYLLGPQDEMMQMSPTSVTGNAGKKTAAALDEVHVEIAQQAAPTAGGQLTDMPAALEATARQPEVPQHAIARRREEPTAEEVVADAVAVVVANTAPIVAEIPSPIESAAPPAAAPRREETVAATAAAPQIEQRTAKTAGQSFIGEAHAADLSLAPPASVFGFSIDEGVFHRIKKTLENNQRPAPAAVNVEAIINYFAGGPATRPRRGVKLEVEGSPSPVGRIGDGGFLRFTIDTPVSASNLPVASDAKLEVDLNRKVVESATPAGDSAATAPEAALRHNLSVTGLYQLTLAPNVRTTDRVATIRLTYTNVADGKRISIDKTVYVRDFTRIWTRASHRHRVAALGAVWAESLKGSSPAPDLVKRAEELVTQNPRDERAQELATAATASSKLPSASSF